MIFEHSIFDQKKLCTILDLVFIIYTLIISILCNHSRNLFFEKGLKRGEKEKIQTLFLH